METSYHHLGYRISAFRLECSISSKLMDALCNIQEFSVTYNDILRRFRYALDISNTTMIEIFRLSSHEIDLSTLLSLLKKEEDPDYLNCSPTVLGYFLDGLIVFKRGAREIAGQSVAKPDTELSNNGILKKIRIALELKEEDMIAIMKCANVTISKPELSALFRSKGQKNYKECGDQFLRSFLQGLTVHFRGIENKQK